MCAPPFGGIFPGRADEKSPELDTDGQGTSFHQPNMTKTIGEVDSAQGAQSSFSTWHMTSPYSSQAANDAYRQDGVYIFPCQKQETYKVRMPTPDQCSVIASQGAQLVPNNKYAIVPARGYIRSKASCCLASHLGSAGSVD